MKLRVPRLSVKRYPKPESPPGELYAAPSAAPTAIAVTQFNGASLAEVRLDDAQELHDVVNPQVTTWVDVQGFADTDLLQDIGRRFTIHPLALADIVNPNQRPKVEEFEGSLVIVTRAAHISRDRKEVTLEQVGIVVQEHAVFTFQEHYGDCLDALRVRLRKNRNIIRTGGTGYFAVAVLDAVVDGYFPVLESIGDRLEALEVEVLERPTRETLRDIFALRSEIMAVRRAILPQRDFFSVLLRDGPEMLPASVRPYLRDAYDQSLHIVDTLETYRELATTYIEIYLSVLSQRTNEVMRLLTVIATIFIPLTFLAGVYGMNFDTADPANMPELGWRYGYIAFWAVCALVTAGLLLAFRRLGWLGGKRAKH